MFINPALYDTLIWIGWGFAAALILALWLSLIFWTYRDIAARSKSALVRLCAVLWVTLLFLPGWFIYLILRPTQTADEAYHHALQEETLLRGFADDAFCPGCKRHVEPYWIVCPVCSTPLKTSCPTCGKPLELFWKVCPYCATPTHGSETRPGQEIIQV